MYKGLKYGILGMILYIKLNNSSCKKQLHHYS